MSSDHKRRVRRYSLIPLIVVLAVSVGCRADDREGMVELPVGEVTVFVEIADEPEERQTGLMHRESLPKDHGMLFVFPESRQRSFWMKNTSIPLSIAYINTHGEILEIHDMEPLSLDPVPSRYAAQYALEVSQGEFKRWNVKPGDVIDLKALPRWVEPR